MRTIQVLLAVLIIAVALLAWQVSELSVTEPHATSQGTANSDPLQPPTPQNNRQSAKPPTLDENRIAAIIRSVIQEELAQLEGFPVGDANSQSQLQQESAGQSELDSHERQIRLQAFEQILDHYKSLGSMTASEVADLELMIARLHPDDRRTAMNQINSSISSGELDARF